VRREYERYPLVSGSRAARIRRGMPAREVASLLGGWPPRVPVLRRVHGRWRHDGACYDYPIAKTGHLSRGAVVAAEVEVCLSPPPAVVRTSKRLSWREVARRWWR
jgi:hypothetical protein